MDHHYWEVGVPALRHHVPHVHLIDGDVTPRTKVAQLTLRLFSLFAADEEAALCFQHQRRVGCLNTLECLRHHAVDCAEDARKGDTDQDGRSAQHRETLTSHVSPPHRVIR
jgi:hypothetical protein